MTDMDTLYRRFGELVRQHRRALRLTQEKVGSRVGLSRTSITNIEKGRQKVLLHQLYDLAAAIETTPASLLPEPLQIDRAAEFERELRARGATEDELDWIKQVVQLPPDEQGED